MERSLLYAERRFLKPIGQFSNDEEFRWIKDCKLESYIKWRWGGQETWVVNENQYEKNAYDEGEDDQA